jgi:uncharacterized protein (DUF1810 family)
MNKFTFKEWCQLAMPHSQLDQSGLPLEETRQLARKMYLGLDRFIEAQDKWNTYQTALEEVKAGKKKTHWIWFIFPQMRGLGTSEKSRYYGISGRNEAIEYINHPILRDRLVEITEAVYNNEKSVYEIFGNDVIKVRSCMLLFASVSDIPIFQKMLEKHCWR